MPIVAEISGNSFIVLGVLILLVPAVGYALFTVKGSGVSKTPHDGRDEAPGAVGPSEADGVDDGEGSATGSDRTGESSPQHGTQ